MAFLCNHDMHIRLDALPDPDSINEYSLDDQKVTFFSTFVNSEGFDNHQFATAQKKPSTTATLAGLNSWFE
jgi:hypothetical protein